MRALDVFYGEQLVGSVFDDQPISFEYASSWLQSPERFAIGSMPLIGGLIDTPYVSATFENLLPEGALREHIQITCKVSTLFGLLVQVAGDSAGGLVLLPRGQSPLPASYVSTTWEEIAQTLAGKPTRASHIAQREERISLAGVQRKMLIALDEQRQPLLPLGTSPSTHIVKPDILQIDGVWSSAANEAIVMRTAQKCGFLTADVFYEPITKTCVVTRFDRYKNNSNEIMRSLQYDLCQLNGSTSTKKYESEGGPGFARCVALVAQHSTQPLPDITRLLEWLFFNWYVGNNDSHAKNLSLYQAGGQGRRLTPFYDLMCTRLYSGLSNSFAFSVGQETLPGNMRRTHWVSLARELKMKPDFVLRVGATVYEKLIPALAAAIAEIEPLLDSSGKALAQRLEQTISSIALENFERLKCA